VLHAWKTLQKLRRSEMALAELPVATLSSLLANINRDPKKAKPFTALDFAVFHELEEPTGQLTPEVAAAALSLRHDGKAPPILLAAWQQILASANDAAKPPSVRALHSDDNRVWVLCPVWEGRNIRGGLVAVCGNAAGRFTLRDIDRQLATYVIDVPRRPLAGWLESGLLLVAETSEHGHPQSAHVDCNDARQSDRDLHAGQ
jgi:hypothetical protein